MPARRLSVVALMLFGAVVAVAGCGGTAASAAPTIGPGSASASAAPTTAATPAPTTAASPTSTPAASATTTAGRTGRIELPDDKVAITLPDGWTEVVLSADDLDTILGNFPQGTFTDEQLAMMKAAVGTGMKLMAFDNDGKGSNVNLLVQETEVPISLLAPALQGQLALIPGASGIKVEQTTVDGVDALKATYDLDQAFADGTKARMSGTQLYVSANGRLYVFTVTLADGSDVNPDDILSTIDLLS